MKLVVNASWQPTDPSQAATGVSLTVVRDDTQAVILSGQAMTLIGSGLYQWTLPCVPEGVTFTATKVFAYGDSQTFTETDVCVPEITPEEICWPHGLRKILDHLTSLMAFVTLKPKLNYSVENHNFSWTEYQTMLGTQIDNITKQLVRQEVYEFVSSGQRGE